MKAIKVGVWKWEDIYEVKLHQISIIGGRTTMVHTTEEKIQMLIQHISTMNEVQAIGMSGCKSPLPKAGEGDIDIFIYCDVIPEGATRQALMHQMGDLLQEVQVCVFEEGHWGVGDFGLTNGVETWLMYFTVEEAQREVESIIDGDYPDKLDNYYYPIGRCAMLQNIQILYERNGFLSGLQERLSKYPESLAEKLIQYHLEELEDREDLERAVWRKDVLFYHFALDLALDHFLQALFAMNREYFPSRKRTLSFIERFNIKPEQCSERLLKVVRRGGSGEGITQSYALWSDLVSELVKQRELLGK